MPRPLRRPGVGGGPAGLAAALAAGKERRQGILADQATRVFGARCCAAYRIGDGAGMAWAEAAGRRMDGAAGGRLLPATTVTAITTTIT